MRARVVERLLCFCAHRVVNRCAAHPPRAGGLSSPQHFLCEEILGAPSAPYMHVGGPHDFARSANSWGTLAAAGWGLQGVLEGRGNWGRGVTPHSDPGKHASGSKSAQAARLLCFAQKVLARFTDLQAMCAGGCRGEPPCPPPAVTHNYPLPPARAPSSLLFSRAASLAARGNTLALWGTPPKKTKRAVTPLRAPGRHNALEKGKNEEEARNSVKFLT